MYVASSHSGSRNRRGVARCFSEKEIARGRRSHNTHGSALIAGLEVTMNIVTVSILVVLAVGVVWLIGANLVAAAVNASVELYD